MIEAHPLAEIVPAMTDAEYEQLRDDIAENGLHEPITLYEEKILDGRHRARACEELEIELKTQELNGADPVAYVVSLNVKRRNLTVGQLAAIALRLLPEERERAAEREQEGRLLGARTSVARFHGPDRRKRRRSATQAAGERVGVSEHSVQVMAQLEKLDPELADRVGNGELRLNTALRRAKGENTRRRVRDTTKPVPLGSERQRQRAAKAHQRLSILILGLDGFRETLENFDVKAALAVATDEDRVEWLRMLTESLPALRQLRSELRQEGQHTNDS